MKVCSFALTDSRRLCEQFVSVDCLGPLFAFFMGKGLGKGVSAKKRKEVALEMQEHVISVLASLLQRLEAGPRRDRVLAKFTEEKLDRLVELWDEYAKRVGSLGGTPPPGRLVNSDTINSQKVVLSPGWTTVH